MEMTVNKDDGTEMDWNGLVPRDVNRLIDATFEQEGVSSIVVVITKAAWDKRND